MPDIFKTTHRNTSPQPEAQTAETPAPQPEQNVPETAEKQEGAGKAFSVYKQTVNNYEVNQKKKKQEKNILAAAEKKKMDYEGQWRKAQKNARKNWEATLSAGQREVEEKRQAEIDRADAEKEKRHQQYQKETDVAQKKLQDSTDECVALQDRCARCDEEIKAAQTFKLEGYDCPSDVQRVLRHAQENDCLSENQKNLMHTAEPEFCAQYAHTPDDLRKLEQNFIQTNFFHRVANYCAGSIAIDDPLVKRYINIAQLIFTAIMVGILFLYAKIEVVPVLVVISLAIMVALGFVFVTGVKSLDESSKKNGEEQDENAGCFGVLVAIAAAIGLTFLFFSWVRNYPILSVIVGAALGFLVRIRGFKTKIMNKKSVLNSYYKQLYKDTARELGKNAGNAPNMIDAMIVSYLKHDALIDYLSQDERARLIRKFTARKQDLTGQLNNTEAVREKYRQEYLKVIDKEKNIEALDALDDIKLQKALEAIDSQYHRPKEPDFSIRSNMLFGDRRELMKLESEVGLTEYQVQSVSDAMKHYAEKIDKIRNRYYQTEAAIKQNCIAIDDWMESEQYPPLINDDQTANFRLDPWICLSNARARTSEPFVLRYSGKPINLVYEKGGNTEGDDLAVLIAELWKAFQKGAPAELLRMAVIDSCEIVRFSMNDVIDVSGFQKYYSPRFEQPDQGNGSHRLLGLFDPREIKQYDEELNDKANKYPEYARRNSAAVEKAPGANQFEKVNFCSSDPKENSAPIIWPYHVAIFVVPGQEEDSFNMYGDEMREMMTLIRRNKTWGGGFLPIFLIAKGDVHQKWEQNVRKSMENGMTYQVNLRNITFSLAK